MVVVVFADRLDKGIDRWSWKLLRAIHLVNLSGLGIGKGIDKTEKRVDLWLLQHIVCEMFACPHLAQQYCLSTTIKERERERTKTNAAKVRSLASYPVPLVAMALLHRDCARR